MGSELAISTKQLTKVFHGKEVIRGCNMTVEKGSIYGFVGKNVPRYEQKTLSIT